MLVWGPDGRDWARWWRSKDQIVLILLTVSVPFCDEPRVIFKISKKLRICKIIIWILQTRILSKIMYSNAKIVRWLQFKRCLTLWSVSSDARRGRGRSLSSKRRSVLCRLSLFRVHVSPFFEASFSRWAQPFTASEVVRFRRWYSRGSWLRTSELGLRTFATYPATLWRNVHGSFLASRHFKQF